MKKLLFAAMAVLIVVTVAYGAHVSVSKKFPAVIAPDNAVGNPQVVQGRSILKVAGVADTVGYTSRDWLDNGPIGGYIAHDDLGNLHFGWTHADGAGANVYPAYNNRDAAGAWLGVVNSNTAPIPPNTNGRYCHVNCKPVSGVGLTNFYTNGTVAYPHWLAIDAGPSAGLFTDYSIPTDAGSTWPYLALATDDTMHMVTSGDYYCTYTNSYDGGFTWSTQVDLSGTAVFDFPNHTIAAWHNKVAIAHRDTFNDVLYKESLDYGATWTDWVNVFPSGLIMPNGDTIVAYLQNSPMYDATGKLIIAVNYYQYTAGTGDYYNGIVTWDAVNGYIYAAKHIATNFDQIGGSNTMVACWPTIAQAGNGDLVIAYSVFDIADTAANGHGNGEIYAVRSANDGATWGTPYNVTNTPTPNAANGSCEDDRYPSCTVLGDSLHIMWLCSKVAGSSLVGDLTPRSYDPMLHYAVALDVLDTLGVAGSPASIPAAKFAVNRAYPNPTRDKATISFQLPKSGRYTMKVYNITGQVVRTVSDNGKAGINTVNLTTTNMANGVYFINLTAGVNSATRKLTVVR